MQHGEGEGGENGSRFTVVRTIGRKHQDVLVLLISV